MAPFGGLTCSNHVLLQFAVSEFDMVQAMANLNESLRLCRFVMMLDEPNLFLVYLSLALEFWCQEGKEKITTNNEFTDHLTTYLRLVDILMTRLKILSIKNGLKRLIDELHRAILNWRSYYTMKKFTNKKEITKVFKVTVLAHGKVMVNLH